MGSISALHVIGSASASAPSNAALPTTCKAEMDPTALQSHLAALAQAHPNEHAFTLALRLQVVTGREITGAQAAKLIEAGGRR